MPTTEKDASLLVAMLRGASDRPWCETMAQGFGMHATLRGASDRPWYEIMAQGFGMGLLIGGERGRPCNGPSRTPCDMLS